MPQPAFTRDEQAAFLNRMLEAERAGANALLNILEEHARHGEAWTVLRRVHADEAHNCGLLGGELRRLGADYSHATGDFLGKLLAVDGRRARVEFLVKGLRWAVKRFDEALPRLDAAARETIAGHARVAPAEHRAVRSRGRGTAGGCEPVACNFYRGVVRSSGRSPAVYAPRPAGAPGCCRCPPTSAWHGHCEGGLGFNPHGGDMFYWAAVFLVIALVAAVLGLGGIAGVSAKIAWIFFIVGLILAVVFFVFGRRGRSLARAARRRLGAPRGARADG